jgi:hypothetical protein
LLFGINEPETMADQQGQSTPNWFERHPKKIMLWLVVILVLAAQLINQRHSRSCRGDGRWPA